MSSKNFFFVKQIVLFPDYELPLSFAATTNKQCRRDVIEILAHAIEILAHGLVWIGLPFSHVFLSLGVSGVSVESSLDVVLIALAVRWWDDKFFLCVI